MHDKGEKTVVIWLLKELELKGLLSNKECTSVISAYSLMVEQIPTQVV